MIMLDVLMGLVNLITVVFELIAGFFRFLSWLIETPERRRRTREKKLADQIAIAAND